MNNAETTYDINVIKSHSIIMTADVRFLKYIRCFPYFILANYFLLLLPN